MSLSKPSAYNACECPRQLLIHLPLSVAPPPPHTHTQSHNNTVVVIWSSWRPGRREENEPHLIMTSRMFFPLFSFSLLWCFDYATLLVHRRTWQRCDLQWHTHKCKGKFTLTHTHAWPYAGARYTHTHLYSHINTLSHRLPRICAVCRGERSEVILCSFLHSAPLKQTQLGFYLTLEIYFFPLSGPRYAHQHFIITTNKKYRDYLLIINTW